MKGNQNFISLYVYDSIGIITFKLNILFKSVKVK